jgi:PTH1 family peptidyl-tRNA hydrolase
VADELAGRCSARFKAHRGRVDVAECALAGQRVVLAKPKSYMNDSGGPVAAACRWYRVPVARLLVMHDELDIPFGALRLKLGGGDNGHNGVRSVRAALGSPEFHRLRFGVGRPPGRMDPADFVLRDFGPAERRELPFLLDRAADAVETLLRDGLAAAQTVYHADGQPPETGGAT